MSVIYEPKGRAREYAALACNLYKNCEHGCLYCFAPLIFRKTRDEFHRARQPRPHIIDNLIHDCEKYQGTTNEPILLCFTCDPYQLGADNSLTRTAIDVIKQHGLNVQILSKGGWAATKDFDLLDEYDRVAASMTFTSDEDSIKWEPGAALPEGRADYLRDAFEKGLTTWASLEPVIDPAQTLEIIRLTNHFVDKYKVGTLNHHPLAKEIDWNKFGLEVVELLQKLGKDYYLKEDLVRKIGLPSS